MNKVAIMAGCVLLTFASAVAGENRKYDVAAFVWPAYQPEKRWAELGVFSEGIGEWQNVKEATPKWKGHRQPLVPLWGYENEADPKVVAKKIDAAVSHGVNVFIYDWYWYGGRPFLEDALNKGFLGAPNNTDMKFFIMWANHHVTDLWNNKVATKRTSRNPIWRAWVDEAEFAKISDRWLEMYFSRPNYYRIGGKPVLMIYEISTFVDGLGGPDKAAVALDALREKCRKAGFGGLHLMACDYGLRQDYIKKLGIDSATIYNFIHHSTTRGNPDFSIWAANGAKRFDAGRKMFGTDGMYFAHASVGWDTNPRFPAKSVQPSAMDSTPEKFEATLRRAKEWTDANAAAGQPKLITINSWNEWTEGSYLEPDTHFKFGYLEAVRRVFGAAPKKTSVKAAPVKDVIKDGVHGYTPKRYVHPKDPLIIERLEWFKDQKIALMMHFGLYSVPGILESWALSDADAHWSRREITWTKDADEFKRQYWNLDKSFNPIRFEPEVWAKTAKECGFKYLIFTTKHHDGFCLFDSKYSDFKVTSPNCPFSTDSRADIVRHVFNAFRKEGLAIGAYFSKPDWHNEDYWENKGVGFKTTRHPTYNIKENPAKWARFAQYAKNQILELVRGYGPLDIIWLDGGQVQRRCGQDIKIEEIIAEARKHTPGLISADRTAGGECENVLTPEQTVPKDPIAVPWESCITIGRSWGYHYDDVYKSPREIVHLLVDVIAKGGNLALNVGPQPDGRLPHQAVERMRVLGGWLKVNGQAIYETRPLPPFRKGNWAFTRNRKTGSGFAIRLWKENDPSRTKQTIPGVSPNKVRHVASGREFACAKCDGGVAFELPADFKADANADVFELID